MGTIRYTPKVANHLTLVLYEANQIQNVYLSGKTHWTIGRKTASSDNDISLLSKIVSRRHGELFDDEGTLYYRDLGSLNGTFLNGVKLPSAPNQPSHRVALHSGDILRIDNQDLRQPDDRGVWMLVISEHLSGTWSFFSLKERNSVLIGRDPEQCDLVEALPYVSRKHAKLEQKKNQWILSDCKSSSGTWLNGNCIQKSVVLQDKDWFSICDCHFVFTGDGLLYTTRTAQRKTAGIGKQLLYADIKSKEVGQRKKLCLLRNIELSLYSGHLIALLGGTGAGKSTLMNCLSGVERAGVTGTIQFHGEDFYSHYERLKYLIGTVPQENVFHDVQSIKEELLTAARLRLPKDSSKRDLEERVQQTIELLGLSSRTDTQIKNLSGGEKKRVNIGIELVADRQLLCLDEPDAGLDPRTKKELFGMLRDLAHQTDKCILTIIHDVSEIRLFDRVIMLVKHEDVGRLAFYGTPDDAFKTFGVENLSDAYAVIAKDPERYIGE